MSYFAAQTGQRPLGAPQKLVLWPNPGSWTLTWAAPPPGLSAVLVFGGPGQPFAELARLAANAQRWPVAAGAGPRLTVAWLRGTEQGPLAEPVSLPQPKAAPAQPADQPMLCPLCRAQLTDHDGIWQCGGRCGAHWLATAPGRLVDLASLPLGVCVCCRPPQALVQSDNGQALCPGSSLAHVILPDGTRRIINDLPYGLCQCCAPAMPLISSGAATVCGRRPQQEYARADGSWTPIHKPASSSAATLQAIDAALRQNSAKISINGVFDLD